jgi:short chain dehydrogenase
MTGTPTSKPDRSGGVGTVDRTHLLLVGAGPGLGVALARRFAVGGYRVTLVARSNDKLADLAGGLSDTGAEIGTIEADASDPEGLGARLAVLYRGERAPGVIIYNAVMGAPDQLLSATVDHLQAAYAVDVISAIVVAQVAAPAMKAAGFGTMIVTRGVDSQIIRSQPSRRSLSARPLSGRPRRCSGPTWSRTVSEWRRSRSPDRSLPVLPLTRRVLLSATGTLSKLTARGRRSFALPAGSEVTRTHAEHQIAGEASNPPRSPADRATASAEVLA